MTDIMRKLSKEWNSYNNFSKLPHGINCIVLLIRQIVELLVHLLGSWQGGS